MNARLVFKANEVEALRSFIEVLGQNLDRDDIVEVSVGSKNDPTRQGEHVLIEKDREGEHVLIEKGRDFLWSQLNQTVDKLELSVRASNTLQNANISYIGELVQITEADFLKLRGGVHRKTLKEIRDSLTPMGLSFGMHVFGWKSLRGPSRS